MGVDAWSEGDRTTTDDRDADNRGRAPLYRSPGRAASDGHYRTASRRFRRSNAILCLARQWAVEDQQLVKRLCRRFPTQGLSRPGIEGRHGGDPRRRGGCSGRALSGSADAAVHWCSRWFRAAMALRIAEVELDTRIDRQTIVLGHAPQAGEDAVAS